MQFANSNGTLTITDEYLDFIYNPSFTYDIRNNIKPNHEPMRIELAKIKTVDKMSLSMSRKAIIIGTIVAILGPVAVIKGNEEGNHSSSSMIFLAVALFIIGAYAAYTGWVRSKLPKANMKGVSVFHYVPKTEKVLGISESVVFVSDKEEEIQNIKQLLQSKIKS